MYNIFKPPSYKVPRNIIILTKHFFLKIPWNKYHPYISRKVTLRNKSTKLETNTPPPKNSFHALIWKKSCEVPKTSPIISMDYQSQIMLTPLPGYPEILPPWNTDDSQTPPNLSHEIQITTKIVLYWIG